MTRIPILRHPVPGSPAEELLRRMLGAEERGACRPAIALSETSEAFHLRVAIPGVDARSLRLAATQDKLVLHAECSQEIPGTPRIDELHDRIMYRKVDLPQDILPDTVTAVLDHGMLQIKASKAATRRVLTAAAV